MTGEKTTVTTPTFRANFPVLFKARRNELSGKDEFSVTALFEKGADLSSLKKAAESALAKKFGDDKGKWPKNLRLPFRDQADKEKDGKLPEGHVAGATFIAFKSKDRPTVVDQNLQEVIEPSKVYSGIYLRASVNAYAYSQAGNHGVSFGLGYVQIVKDGAPLSGRPSIESAFTPIATEASDAGDLFG